MSKEFKIPDNVTNPKTIRRYERYKKQWEELIDFAKANGYETDYRGVGVWSFQKGGVKSVLGFDSETEVLVFIKKNLPDPERIFPPYK